MSGPEQRIHSRIHVSTKIEVSTADGMMEAELKDLSKGGARFEIAAPVGAPGETIELSLPSLDGAEITIMAQIIRHTPGPGAMHTVAVRFDVVEPAMQQALLDLCDVLLSTSGGGRRAHPRVARRIEVRFGQLEDLRGILEDISSGGLLMTVPQPLVLYEEIDVTVPDMGGGELLILHARVVNQRSQVREGETVYRVGLEFSSLRPETRMVLEALLKSVMAAIDEPPA
jgi:c-di-GMP-binding flagellar brake protein YcgR